MLYLCGHPGTGKTSTLNLVLSQMQANTNTSFELFLYNAMTYENIKIFARQALDDINLRLGGSIGSTFNQKRCAQDEEYLSELVAASLKNNKKETHKILVIDEIDCFQNQEKAFLTFIKGILKDRTNTSIIGIANSVDLPFKKKHSALAMRDSQLLF